MGKEEQLEEREILESIYPDEIDIYSDESYGIHLKLDTEPVQQLLVEVQYPQDYPESVIPSLSVSAETLVPEDDGGSEEEAGDEAQPTYTYTLNAADCAELKRRGDEVAEENLGIPSVFTVVSFIKDQAEELYESKIKDQEAERLRKLNLEEEKEQAKFKGTPVTKQTFAEWRENFRREMGLDKPKERPSGRFTGREIFDKGMYKEEDEDDDANAEIESSVENT